MKRFLPAALLVCFFCCFNTVKAQYVTIPDPNFAGWLTNSAAGMCMHGNQLDTTCNEVLTIKFINVSNDFFIHDLSGIQYFRNLDSLACEFNYIDSMPALPNSLKYLWAGSANYNNYCNISSLPASLLVLECWQDSLTSLPTLPPGLQYLDAGNNFYQGSLPSLPNSLQYLRVYECGLDSLPQLPAGLLILDCSSNNITTLPPLPDSMQELDCQYSLLTSLLALPSTLRTLNFGSETLDTVSPLPVSIDTLGIYNTNFQSFPFAIPDSVTQLTIAGNILLDSLAPLPPNLYSLTVQDNSSLKSLPSLPATLTTLETSYDSLISLPLLPQGLQLFQCVGEPINTLPALPQSILNVNVSYDYQLTSIPALPAIINGFSCAHCTALTCLPALTKITTLNFESTAVTCLPDYGSVTTSTPPLDSVPLCGIFNQPGCSVYWDISGIVYYDANSDCVFDSADVGEGNVKVQLDSNGVLIQQTYTSQGGGYSFKVPYGAYTLVVDTSIMPLSVNCTAPALKDTISASDSLSYENNFALKCRAGGFDLGIQSINYNYVVVPRPGAVTAINTLAGDISYLYGAHCAGGIGGKVQMVYSGPLTLLGPGTGALVYAVNGDTITWNIADFGNVNDSTAFNLIFRVNYDAVAGTDICFTALVTLLAGDFNPANNSLTYCVPVQDSWDPNGKEVYPLQVDTDGWLTYTIRFQNTGTAAAVNIRVVDTLSPNLDPSTFQLLTYSAKNLTQILDNVVVFNFPNINLPDSLTSDSASRGFVQYKIKLISGLVQGTAISNRASIYFDQNEPVVTNTVTDTVRSCQPTDTVINASICFGHVYDVGGILYHTTGTFTDTLQSTGGCDSIITLNLTINPIYRDTITDTVCSGDTFYVGHFAHTAAGNYIDTLNTIYGCDSIVNLTLALKPAPVVTLSWDSMVASGYFVTGDSNKFNYGFGSDTGSCVSGMDGLPLLGGLPPGGTYSGSGVWNDSIWFDSVFSSPDTIIYIYTNASNCSVRAKDVAFITICMGIDLIPPTGSVSIYPNPATDLIYIKTEGIQPNTTSIYDVNGQLVYTGRFTPQLDVSKLTPGAYLIEVTAPEGTARRMFVKM